MVPVPLDPYCPDMRNKTKQNITKDDRYCIYYFYCWLFLVFKNLALVWEITLGAHRSCELLPRGGCVCREGAICGWILENRMCVCRSWLPHVLRAIRLKTQVKRLQNKSSHRPGTQAKYRTKGGRWRPEGLTGISLWWERKPREVGKVPERIGKSEAAWWSSPFQAWPKGFSSDVVRGIMLNPNYFFKVVRVFYSFSPLRKR